MARSSGGANQLVMLLLLLGILGGAGAWNYQRNAALEDAEPRPYKSYSLEELESLRAAYQGEVDRHTERYRNATGRSVVVQDGGYLDKRVDEFERVQRISVGKRKIADDYARNQVQLDAVKAELQKRAAEGSRWEQIFRRVTTLP
jgi:hypothetical protein